MAKLAFSTNAFKKHTLEDAIDAIGGVGYRGIEVMADVPHAYPPRMDARRTRNVGNRIASGGMAVSNVNAFTLFACGDTYHPTWIEHDGALRQTRVDHTRAAIELAAALGATTVSVQPGGPLIGTGLSPDAAAERFAEGLAQLVPVAKRLGVVLAVEPEPGLLIQTSREYAAFKSRYFSREDAIRMNCDIGHLFCVGEDAAAVIRAMPEQIAHVHVEDIGENRVHQHLTPGRGVIDFAAVFNALHDVGYAGWATVELYPYEAEAAEVAKAAFKNLRGFAN